MEKKILIIDDEPLIRTALSSAFRREDTAIIAVSCGTDALREINDDRFDLCFIDIHLPDMNGLSIMKTVKAVSPGTTIVIMTGGEVDADMLRSIQQSASLLVAKPFDLDRLTAFAARILAQDAPLLQTGSGRSDQVAREPFVNWLAEDRRRYARYTFAHTVSCVPAAADDGPVVNRFAASVTDLSAAGMGIQTDCPLDPGHVLEFSGSALYGKGIVCWSMNVGAPAAWRAGVRFVDPEYAHRVSG